MTMQTTTPPLRTSKGWLTATPELLAEALRASYPKHEFSEAYSLEMATHWLEYYDHRPEAAIRTHKSSNVRDTMCTHCLVKLLGITPSVSGDTLRRMLHEPPRFAEFNCCPHLCVDVPDGYFTISARMSNGKRITFAFVQTKGKDGEPHPAGCVDIEYHDGPKAKVPDGRMLNSFHSIGFTAGSNTYDTRKVDKPTTLITVLVDDDYYKTGGE